MKILRHEYKNNWLCELLDLNIETIASLGYGERSAFFVKSFRHPDSRWWELVEYEMGKPDAYYKDALDLSLEELAEVNNRVTRRL